MLVDYARISAVPYLDFPRSPYAIIRLVVAVIVRALDGHSWRAAPHVFKEVFENTPSLANRNSTRSVIRVCLCIFVFASLMHSAPNIMSPRFRESVARSCAIFYDFILKAAARFCSARPYICSITINNVPALALHFPDGTATFTASRHEKCGQSAKFAASKINEFHICNSSVCRMKMSNVVNGKPNKRCWGVWTRSLERRDKCLGGNT